MSEEGTARFIERYKAAMHASIDAVTASDQNGPLTFERAVDRCVEKLLAVQKAGRKVIMLGNGGSAGIASHQAVDYWKNGAVRALAFNDGSLLTCIGNDLGFDQVFSAPVERFADPGDLVYAISSSGSSPNILRAASSAVQLGADLITFSGFAVDNPLRSQGSIDFHVPSFSYGLVEITHLFIIHAILDAKLQGHDGRDVFNKNQTFAP